MSEMIRKFWKDILVVFFSILCGILLGIYNYKNNPNFLITPLSTIISILVAVIVSYFLVQRKNDNRRKREKADKLLYKIQEIVLDDSFIACETEEIARKNLIRHRSVGNKIQYIKDMNNTEIKEYIEKVSDAFDLLRELYSEHYTDCDYLNKSSREFIQYRTLIDDTCDKIHTLLL